MQECVCVLCVVKWCHTMSQSSQRNLQPLHMKDSSDALSVSTFRVSHLVLHRLNNLHFGMFTFLVHV